MHFFQPNSSGYAVVQSVISTLIFALPNQVAAYLPAWLGRLCLFFHCQTVYLLGTSCLGKDFLFKATARMKLGLGNSMFHLSSFFHFSVFAQLSRTCFFSQKLWNREHCTARKTLQVFNHLECKFTDTFSYSQAYPCAMQIMFS